MRDIDQILPLFPLPGPSIMRERWQVALPGEVVLVQFERGHLLAALPFPIRAV
jgi:hypothetical protein